GADRAAAEGETLRRLSDDEADGRRVAAEAGRRAQHAEVALARLGGPIELEGTPVTEEVAAVEREAAEALAAAEAAAAHARAAADRSRAADAALAQRAPRRPTADVDLLRRLRAVVCALGESVGRAGTLAERLQ